MSKKVWISVAVLAACAALGAVSLKGSVVPRVDFAAIPKQKERVKAYGILVRESIKPVEGATTVSFELKEETTGSRLTVLYDNPTAALPPNFPAASHALVTGAFDPVTQRLVADSVATKCPSKYQQETSIDPGTQTAIDRWQRLTGARPSGS